MYEHILNGIKSQNNIQTDEKLAEHLISLQPNVKNLRSAFRKYPVQFDYKSKTVQDSYMTDVTQEFKNNLERISLQDAR